MTENKSSTGSPGGAGILAKRVQRQLSRAQEKVLQKLGKAVETKDEQFEQLCENLNKQQVDGHRLYKDVKAYFRSVQVMHEASKRLSQTLLDLYNCDLQGEEDLSFIMVKEEPLWCDYKERLEDQTVRLMENYMSQFPEVKEKVAKRGRKLVDYDSSRHHLETVQNAKKKDDTKITKAKEEFSTAEKIFEDINTELREELPTLYHSRTGCYVTVFHSMSSLRDIFYHEMCTLNHEVFNVMKKLENQHSDEVFAVKGLQRKRRSRKFSSPIKSTFPTLSRKFSFRSSERGRESEYGAGDRDTLTRKTTSAFELRTHSPPKAARILLREKEPSEVGLDSELNFRDSNESLSERKSEAGSDGSGSEGRGSAERLGVKQETKEDEGTQAEENKPKFADGDFKNHELFKPGVNGKITDCEEKGKHMASSSSHTDGSDDEGFGKGSKECPSRLSDKSEGEMIANHIQEQQDNV